MNIGRWSITAAACFVIVAGLAAYKVLEIKAAIAFGESFPEHSETVETATVQLVDYRPSINAIGEAVAPKRLDLRNELAGVIVSVDFVSGGQLTDKQLMIQLDISEETANLTAAMARADLARTVFKRISNLRKSNTASQEQLDEARANLRVVEAEIVQLQSLINKKSIRAPFAGVAGLHQFEAGQFLPSNTLITTVVGDHDDMWVDFGLPQFYNDLLVGQTVKLRPVKNQPTSDVADKPSAAFVTGEIVAKNSVISGEARSRRYRARVDNRTLAIAPTAALEVNVPIGDRQRSVAVVATAVQNDNHGQFVYLLAPDSNADNAVDNGSGRRGYRAQRQTIKTVGRQGDLIIVSDGLAQGDLVAAAGAFKLNEGILVFTAKRANAEAPDSAGNHSDAPSLRQSVSTVVEEGA